MGVLRHIPRTGGWTTECLWASLSSCKLLYSPNLPLHLSSNSVSNAFVRPPPSCSGNAMYSSLTSPLRTDCYTCWCQTLIWRVRRFQPSFFARAIAPWLSTHMGTAPGFSSPLSSLTYGPIYAAPWVDVEAATGGGNRKERGVYAAGDCSEDANYVGIAGKN